MERLNEKSSVFFATATEAFSFLVAELGFERPSYAEAFGGQLRTVEFRSATGWVRVTHERFVELDVEIGVGLPERANRGIRLTSLVRAHDPAYRTGAEHASTPEALRICVPRLAAALRRFGAAALRGDLDDVRPRQPRSKAER